MKKALRAVIERYELPVRLTANQNLMLLDVEPTWKADIITTLGALAMMGLAAGLFEPMLCLGRCCCTHAAVLGCTRSCSFAHRTDHLCVPLTGQPCLPLCCATCPPLDVDTTAPPGTAGVKELFELDAIERTSMACPALPLCGLAIGEAERTISDVNRRVRALLDRLQFPADYPIVVSSAFS